MLQGVCKDPVPPAMAAAAEQVPLVATLPGQCVLLSKDRIFQFGDDPRSPIWVDNIYVRLLWPPSTIAGSFVNLMGVDKDVVYLTNVTFQGDSSMVMSRALDPWLKANVYFGGALLVLA
jgi:hypothetical protein